VSLFQIGVAMIAVFFTLAGSVTAETATCYIDSGDATVRPGQIDRSGAAWAWWEETLNSTGFNHITIETNSAFDSHSQLFCAGFVDAYLTQHRIWERFQLYKDIVGVARNASFSVQWTDWLQLNLDYMRMQVSTEHTNYWRDVGLVLSQFDGLVAGYAAVAPDSENLTELDILIIQSIGDLDDLDVMFSQATVRDETYGMECSGLVKLAPNKTDVWFAHNTWSDFRTLTLYVKEYDFAIPEWKAKRVIVATKMGALHSSTDFWLTDQGLLILETTNGNYNNSLYERVTTESVLTWVRALVASWTAESAPGWANEFLKENSGTYNNQYVIVDAKKFTPGETPSSDFVWSTSIFLMLSHGDHARYCPEA
jgi:hypothetical protein